MGATGQVTAEIHCSTGVARNLPPYSREAVDAIKMLISTEQRKTSREGTGGDPDIVLRNRHACSFKVMADAHILARHDEIAFDYFASQNKRIKLSEIIFRVGRVERSERELAYNDRW